MKAEFKKRLLQIQKDLHELTQDHESWMEEHEDPNWEFSPSGEKASEENQEMCIALDYIQSITQVELED